VNRRRVEALRDQARDGLADALRLLDVVLRRFAVRNGAVRAVARADAAQNHERGGAVLPAFPDVGAMRFFAHGMEIELLHHVLETDIVFSARGFDLQPRRLPFRKHLAAVPPHDLYELLSHIGTVVPGGGPGT
jgi:hypothetical protein